MLVTSQRMIHKHFLSLLLRWVYSKLSCANTANGKCTLRCFLIPIGIYVDMNVDWPEWHKRCFLTQRRPTSLHRYLNKRELSILCADLKSKIYKWSSNFNNLHWTVPAPIRSSWKKSVFVPKCLQEWHYRELTDTWLKL